MGAVKSKVDVERIHNEVSSSAVTVYTKDHCSFCTRTKDLLQEEQVEYTEYNVDRLKEDSPEQYSPVVNGLVYMTRQTTMPQIFICGKFVGGFTDLQKLKESHKLLDAIMECTGENAPHE
ncbi:hypothetical protein Q1695_014949 [Nippostrongylus brasiliensis]|nr:hypothetical protein Q1695_014949 [Nippostrongylus brasiliensis]